MVLFIIEIFNFQQCFAKYFTNIVSFNSYKNDININLSLFLYQEAEIQTVMNSVLQKIYVITIFVISITS